MYTHLGYKKVGCKIAKKLARYFKINFKSSPISTGEN